MDIKEQGLLEQFFVLGYREGLAHGFTVGKGKPARPEDEKRLIQLEETMTKKIHADFEAQKGLKNADDQE